MSWKRVAAEFSDRTIGQSEADRLFRCLDASFGVGLAVSGGADSVALMRLFADWRARIRPDLAARVFTVDHGLRAEAEAEAARVARWAAEVGLEHETLVWRGARPRTSIQETARNARYKLLSERCAALGLTHLVTGHHLDDQAETVLMRLARGSGMDGLAGMARHVPLRGLVLTRPLLEIPKARLVGFLRGRGQSWIEDPSNSDMRFARARLRQVLPLLAEEGLTAARLGEVAKRAARARSALDSAAGQLHRAAVTEDPAGFCRLDAGLLAAAPEEIGLRLLGGLVTGLGGSGRPLRQARLERLHEILVDHAGGGSTFTGATLGGCRITPDAGAILLFREMGRVAPPTITLMPCSAVIWDRRFRISMPDLPTKAVVQPLGAEGLVALRKSSVARKIPAAAARVSPGVFISGELYAAPQIEEGRGRFSPPGVEVCFLGGTRIAAVSPLPQAELAEPGWTVSNSWQ